MRLFAVSLCCLLALSCAARAPRRPSLALDLSAADRLVDVGCYRCLQEAFEQYAHVRGRVAAPADLDRRLFSAALLLALREKELGLDATPWLDRARPLAMETERTYLDIVAAIPWETAGTMDFTPPSRPTPLIQSRWRAFVAASSPQPLLDRYLRITLACNLMAGSAGDGIPIDVSPADVPILRYRAGICGSDQRHALEALVGEDGRYAEARFYLGKYELGSAYEHSDWLTRALPHLTAAHDAFPEAPVITVILAGAVRAHMELARSVALYDDALAARPTQRDALLGRTIALTYLDRAEEAIATATRMVDLGTWHMGDAYYWRAWNDYQRRDLDAAARDVADARKYVLNSDVLTLSGMVAYDRQRRADARRDFDAARRSNADNCIAAWYLGLLDIDEQTWRPAAGMFSIAASCYRAAADALRADAETLPSDLPPDARAQQTADYSRRIADALRRAGRSALNAAQAWILLGDRDAALDQARLASSYDGMKERAEALMRSLETR